MTIVITRPNFFDGEIAQILSLLQRPDIDRLHLRKPEAAEADVEALLCQIPHSYYSRIVMHDFFALAERYHLVGIHLTHRHPTAPTSWRGDVSTSCHSIHELEQRRREQRFAYLSLSPIFDSISKSGYKAAFTPQQIAEARLQGIIDHNVLALGGVTFSRLPQVLSMGFGGGMILGDAWK